MDKMPRPNENWGEGDWEEFYKAGGRPETPKDYGDYEMPDWWDEDIKPWSQIQSEWQNTFFKLGLSKKQTDAIIEFNAKQNEFTEDSIKRMTQENIDRNKDALTNEWGRAYEQKEHRAKSIIEKGTKEDEGLHKHILQKMEEDILLKKWMANMADNFFEHSLVESPSIDTPSDTQDKIDDLMQNSPVLKDPRSTPAERMKVMDKVMRLREEKNKT